jgi:hypothetical protein
VPELVESNTSGCGAGLGYRCRDVLNGPMTAGAGTSTSSLPYYFEHGSSSGVFDLATKVRVGRHAYSAMT